MNQALSLKRRYTHKFIPERIGHSLCAIKRGETGGWKLRDLNNARPVRPESAILYTRNGLVPRPNSAIYHALAQRSVIVSCETGGWKLRDLNNARPVRPESAILYTRNGLVPRPNSAIYHALAQRSVIV